MAARSDWTICGKRFVQVWIARPGRARLCCTIDGKPVSSAAFEAAWKSAKKAEQATKQQ